MKHQSLTAFIVRLVFTAFLMFSVFLIGPLVRAYESDQLADCISSAMQNPSLEDVSDSSIQNYCKCALDLIVDQNQEVRSSGYLCALKSFTELQD